MSVAKESTTVILHYLNARTILVRSATTVLKAIKETVKFERSTCR